ncbi:MAG: hypothetical protein L0229_24255 [Blastocatellia bacterium]|nr:hypothetical protein [Blastocatellia bacterium]
MDIVRTVCLSCKSALEFPRDFDNVVCPNCGAAYQVREYKGAVNLTALEAEPDRLRPPESGPNGSGGLAAVDLRLAELDELIEAVGSEIEVIKSREQAGPLQAGCAFFGIFGMVLVVLAFFMTVGRTYFGGWLFYLSLAAVILVGLMRMRSRVAAFAQAEQLRDERIRLESGLAQMEEDRDHLERLKEKAVSKESDLSAEKKGS